MLDHALGQGPVRANVRVQPLRLCWIETGQRGLFIGGFAQSTVGLGPSDSRDLLRVFQT
ncbi:hypothetical protein [Streptomyces violaceus]|uniref:hypothetical protein n=1 Tax=Streptomyces violaceus TaxID=1936 RepID=UPI0019BB764D|nr:hypothetical protein GCM10010270_26620 [Streptomyces janthinus]